MRTSKNSSDLSLNSIIEIKLSILPKALNPGSLLNALSPLFYKSHIYSK